MELRIDGRWKTDFPNAKVLIAPLKPGDAFQIRSGGGGGGYGSPLERPVDEVENDFRQGYVTLAAALELYGVVIDSKPSRPTCRRRKSCVAPSGAGLPPRKAATGNRALSAGA